MSHRFDSLLLRGLFGTALGLAAIAGAVTQVLDSPGTWRMSEGRLVFEARSEGGARCADAAPTQVRVLDPAAATVAI